MAASEDEVARAVHPAKQQKSKQAVEPPSRRPSVPDLVPRSPPSAALPHRTSSPGIPLRAATTLRCHPTHPARPSGHPLSAANPPTSHPAGPLGRPACVRATCVACCPASELEPPPRPRKGDRGPNLAAAAPYSGEKQPHA